jgi:DNA-binding PadR family transcriptional regulator
MNNKLLLLGILRQQDMHGYRLYEFIDRDLSVCTDLKKPTAYYLLNQMAEDGWVRQEQSQEGNRPPRKVYHLTESGEAAFERLLRRNLGEYSQIYFPGDVGLAFIEALDVSESIELLEKRRNALELAIEETEKAPEHPGSTQWVIAHRLHHLRAELDWLTTLIAQFQRQVRETIGDQ